MNSRHHLLKQYKVDLRFRKASSTMFRSLSCQRLLRGSFTHGYPTHLPIVVSQTSLKLQPFRHNMSTAIRATREDGSGMQQLDLLLRILLIPQWRIFRRRISTDILGIAGCTCATTQVSGHVCWPVRYNEAYNLSQRYLRFDLQELIRIAVKAASEEGAHRCMLSRMYNHVIIR